MLTRSKAKAVASENTTVIVTPSATGQGVHTRWIYPNSPATPSPPSRTLQIEETSKSLSSSGTSSQAGSWSSGSSLSTLSDSSLSSLSDTSFHALPSYFHLPSTPPLTPKKLGRSPLNQRWIQEGTSWRLTLVHDSFTPEDAIMQESMIRRQTEEIHNRQLGALMASRERARRALGLDLPADDDSDDMDTDDEEGREFIREDTEPAEENIPGSSQGPQRLGPHSTELIDHDSFTSVHDLPVYPEAWITRRKMVRWQRTEEFIN